MFNIVRKMKKLEKIMINKDLNNFLKGLLPGAMSISFRQICFFSYSYNSI